MKKPNKKEIREDINRQVLFTAIYKVAQTHSDSNKQLKAIENAIQAYKEHTDAITSNLDFRLKNICGEHVLKRPRETNLDGTLFKTKYLPKINRAIINDMADELYPNQKKKSEWFHYNLYYLYKIDKFVHPKHIIKRGQMLYCNIENKETCPYEEEKAYRIAYLTQINEQTR